MASDPLLQAYGLKYVSNPRGNGRDQGIFVGDLPDDDLRPAGTFVVGPLSGLSPEARRAAQEQATPAYDRQVAAKQLQRHAYAGAPVASLTDVLLAHGRNGLAALAAQYLPDEVYRTVDVNHDPLESLVRAVADVFLGHPERLERSLRRDEGSSVRAAQRLAREGGSYSCPDNDVPEDFCADSLLPYFALYHHKGRFIMSATPELRDLLGQVDYAGLDAARALDDEVVNVANCCAGAYGVVPLDEAYGIYRRAYPHGLGREGFDRAIGDYADADMGMYGTWSHDGVGYLVGLDLSADTASINALRSAAGRLRRELNAQHTFAQGEEGTLQWLEAYESEAETYEARAFAEVDRAVRQAEEDRVLLLEGQAGYDRWEMPAELARQGLFDAFGDTREARQLVAYLDAHVPEAHADDLYFADDLVEELCKLAFFGGMPGSVVEYALESFGLRGCDGSGRAELPETLLRLARNYYDTLPKWHLNGWSELGLMERRARGRKLFFDAEGIALNPGRNDPCPCGSGKKYKRCHGR